MKIAIACTGLEHVYRGFESFSQELFNSLESKIPVHLLKGSGKSDVNIRVISTIKRTSKLYNFFPFNRLNAYYQYRNECISFGYFLIPLLLQNRYDIIHFSDGILGEFLLKVRGIFGLNYKLLFSNGAPYEPIYCNKFDAIQQVALSHYEDAVHADVSVEKMFLVPYGFNKERLIKPNNFNQNEFRQKFGIPQNAYTIVCLAALNSTHKRLDWLIKEFAHLAPEKYYLIMAGNRESETLELENSAKQILPKQNYQFLTLPYEQIPPLIWSSNLMVLCSLYEGFGRVLCEAMGASLPLLLHPHSTAKWVVKCEDCFVDMTKPGHLHEKIQSLSEDSNKQSYIIQQNLNQFETNFEWQVLRQSYIDMYAQVLNSNFKN